MTFSEKLRDLLEELGKQEGLEDLSIEIQPSGGGRYVVIMLSESFAKYPDYARQELVWQKILDHLDDYEQRLVEFVHTATSPEEGEEDEGPIAPSRKTRKKPAKRR